MTRYLEIAALGLALGLVSAVGTASGNEDMILKKAHEGSAAAPSGPIKVDKAAGLDAYTVAELYAKGAALEKTKVTVRGQVVKVSLGIMDRNWIHLRDGSGDQAKGTHNLVVTSHDRPALGEVVTATGILAKDKDFGSGYRYPVIVEEAHIRK